MSYELKKQWIEKNKTNYKLKIEYFLNIKAVGACLACARHNIQLLKTKILI